LASISSFKRASTECTLVHSFIRSNGEKVTDAPIISTAVTACQWPLAELFDHQSVIGVTKFQLPANCLM
ncbi:hypothetical protein NZA98_19650, partial [Escherichia coli]|nr:hypothetical protein [Escherichia coli]